MKNYIKNVYKLHNRYLFPYYCLYEANVLNNNLLAITGSYADFTTSSNTIDGVLCQ